MLHKTIIEPRLDSDGLELAIPVPATKREQRALERIPGHFTVPQPKMGMKMLLYCWCGDSIELNVPRGDARQGPEVRRFVTEHMDCAANEESVSA